MEFWNELENQLCSSGIPKLVNFILELEFENVDYATLYTICFHLKLYNFYASILRKKIAWSYEREC